MTVNKEKIKTGVWGAIVGAIIVMIIGFGWGGWVLGSTSQKNADTMVADALGARLVPMCVAQFNADAEKETKFKELKAKNYWEREKYVEEQGWATMPFEKESDSEVAEVCVEQILNGQ
ncbi:MAG: hypothetical protein JSV31_03910 [Desulfobacterales bacterium]|jgi:hypothetical protein|nr:MAG: hypothetical protein JSV31_03910 [Desulfobacterales bacterium]